MASIPFLFLAMLFTAAAATNQYRVGDAEGWRTPEKNETHIYEEWAGKIKFQVGDSILFEYKNDSVVRVSKIGYYHCNESSDGMELKDGSAVFLLDRSGLYYFVSGDSDHCKRGERVVVDVIGSPSSSSSPAAIGGPSPSPMPSHAAVSSSPRMALVVVAVLGMIFSLHGSHL